MVMEFACTFSLLESIPSVLHMNVLRRSWHFRGFVLLRVYLLHVVFGGAYGGGERGAQGSGGET